MSIVSLSLRSTSVLLSGALRFGISSKRNNFKDSRLLPEQGDSLRSIVAAAEYVGDAVDLLPEHPSSGQATPPEIVSDVTADPSSMESVMLASSVVAIIISLRLFQGEVLWICPHTNTKTIQVPCSHLSPRSTVLARIIYIGSILSNYL